MARSRGGMTRKGSHHLARSYFTYIMTNRSGTLYVGMTNDLVRRVWEHKHALVPGFTSRYRIDRLVYYETYSHPRNAIAREKEIKGWLRAKKVALIEAQNRKWLDLSKGWYDEGPASAPRQSPGATGSC